MRVLFLIVALAAFAAAPGQAASAAKAVAATPGQAAQTPAPAAIPAAQAEPSSVPALQLPATICGQTVGAPSRLPPPGGPYLTAVMLCFEKQGGSPVVEANTYLYYLQLRGSQPSAANWVAFNDAAQQTAVGDFRRLWATNFLDDLLIEVRDVRYANGVIGKVVVYNMEERQRVKIVDYVGSTKVEQSKIDEELKKRGITIRLDSFIDPGLIRRVSGVVHDLYAEKGYEFVEVKPEVKPVEGGPKLVNVSFHITEGPKVRIRKVDFMGNSAIKDGTLERRLKENKGQGTWPMSILTSGGTYKAEKFEDDADRIVEYYRDRGYINIRVGQPDLKVLEDAKDNKTRWVELRIPITEGNRYRVGKVDFEGNTIAKAEGLLPLFKIKEGEFYSEKVIRKGFEKAKELYGTGGYMEFTGYPDLAPRDAPATGPASAAAGPPGPPAAAAVAGQTASSGPPVVDVTLRMQEGKQYFINRITFVGNTTTRDNVIRREVRLVESGVFNTEALKFSVKRLNQLGYFKPLEGEAISVEKTAGADNKVDVKLKFEEQNRNQLTFGAGVSQYDGFFGQLSFQTANFLGRGETFTISAQQGSRATNYQLAFSEPFLFDRPQTAGVDLFIRELQYIGLYTQKSQGGNLVYGFQVQDFARMFVTYSFEDVQVKDLNPAFRDERVLRNNPLLADSLLIGAGGKRTISKIGPSYVYNTVDNPIFPTAGKRFTASADVAGLGGNTKFVNPRAEGIWYIPHTRRTSLGFRVAGEYLRSYGNSISLPIFQKIFLGGEYSIRGFDLRSVSPRDPSSGVQVGGNKSLLFNAEYLISIAGPVRLVLFYDAGQVRDVGAAFAWKDPLTERVQQGSVVPSLVDLDFGTLSSPLTGMPAPIDTRTIGYTNAFKSSTGAEIRFFMPVLNVPFRLIFAMNPSRGGVLDNNLQPEKRLKFRFAVGSTF
ncbi:MAG: BamA/TamA family outer membrane protein, partial [Acidobacteriota bacterium]|nr:BamA/TamA family outer membrane protein [Acidobacteriota bacterium]